MVVNLRYLKNRNGECCKCGKNLGFYDTKFVQTVAPYAIMCFHLYMANGQVEDECSPDGPPIPTTEECFGPDAQWAIYTDS